ncbi:MAG: hypothetical protein ACRDLM_10585 [Gaiellaceae bacterium]
MAKPAFVAALLAAAIVAVTSAFAATASPHIQLGVLGNPMTFDPLTHQHTTTRLIIIGWDQDRGFPGYFANLFSTMADEPTLGIGIPNGSSLTPQSIAHGAGDRFLVALNQGIVAFDMPIYVRPLAEMNGHWNSYCAYNANGSSKGPRYSTSNFRKAFTRIYLILHGAPNANAKLHKMGLPPVNGSVIPAPKLKVIWNPQGYGSPDLPGNSAAAYYPGDGYADVVGDDLYDIKGKAEWAAADAMYRRWRHKVFAFPEWGLWNIDDPAFIRAMYRFILGHRRTKVVSYFDGQNGSIFDLRNKPHSLKLYRQLIAPLGN